MIEIDGLVTAPVSKQAIIRSGQVFVGQTEFLSDLAGAHRAVMMLLGTDDRGRWLRVALATTHLPLKEVAEQLTQTKVELAIELAARACRDLGLSRARIGVCGLNPHAGEGGPPRLVGERHGELRVDDPAERLDRVQLQALAQAGNDALARRITPFGTLFDGDITFAVSTAAVAPATPLQAEALVSQVVPMAVERAVLLARGTPAVPGLADGPAAR